jgi:ribosome-binding factor A
MSPRRSERVADLIRREIARLLREEVRDPRIGFVTITDVELSADLRNSRVFVSTLDTDADQTLAALNRAVPFIRRGLARQASLRFTPRLRFLIDRGVTAGTRVDGILEELRDRDEAGRPATDDSSEPEGDAD